MRTTHVSKKLLICVMLALTYGAMFAQKKQLTPEEKRKQKYEKTVKYMQVAHTLDSLSDEQEQHNYLIIYDGYEYEEPLHTIDPDKVHKITVKRPNACTVGKKGAFEYVVIITTQSTYLRRLNRERAKTSNDY